MRGRMRSTAISLLGCNTRASRHCRVCSVLGFAYTLSGQTTQLILTGRTFHVYGTIDASFYLKSSLEGAYLSRVAPKQIIHPR